MEIGNLKVFARKNKYYILLAIILILVLLWIFPIRMYHWWDETVYLQNAEVIFSGVDNYNEFSFRPPLLSLMYAAIFFIWHSPIAASIFTSLLCFLLVIFVFLIGNKLFNLRVGLIAGAIVMFSPFILINAHFLMTDVPVATLLAISFFLLLFEDRKLALFFSGAFLSLAVLMKFTAVLFLPVVIFYTLIKKFRFKKLLFLGTGSVLFILPYFLWAQFEFGNFLHPFIKGSSMVTSKNHGFLFYFSNLHETFTFLAPLGLLAWFFLFYKNVRNYSDNFDWIKNNLTLLVWIAIFLIYLTKTAHKELRYILPITVPILLLSSQGWDYILKFTKKINRRVLIPLIIIFLVFSLFLFAGQLGKSPVFEEISFVANNTNPTIKMSNYIREKNWELIYTRHNWPVYAYYTGKEIKLIPWNKGFYRRYKNVMTKKGVIIINTDKGKEPPKKWLENNSKFKFVESKGPVYAYEFHPNN